MKNMNRIEKDMGRYRENRGKTDRDLAEAAAVDRLLVKFARDARKELAADETVRRMAEQLSPGR